jgi:outer membrane protein, heavy metal efflux system
VQARSACERAAADAVRQAELILPRAEESARTLERSFELGEANLIDAIDARRVLLEARRAALASTRQREVDCGTSLILSGRELP